MILLVSALVVLRVNAQNRSKDAQTLLNFKEIFGTGFGDIGYLASWNESDDNPCAWVGVTCTSSSTVSELDFSGWWSEKGLLGYYFSQRNHLSSLSDLSRLDLSHNSFFDFFVENLTGLTHLDISANQLGEFPRSLWNLTKLQWLDLSSNLI
jgi:Leucine-rich repeat (LRR) protein